MKLNEILLMEENLESTLKKIKSECSEFLKQSRGNALYRGQNYKHTYKNNTHENRYVKDTGKMMTNLFNMYIEDKFNIKNIRTQNVLFAFSYANSSNDYRNPDDARIGSLRSIELPKTIMFIFPINGYESIWSPGVKDFFYIAREIYRNARNVFIKNNKNDYNIDEMENIWNIIESPAFKLSNLKDKNVLEIYNIFKELFDKLSYRSNTLPTRVNDSEVMLITKSYYAISIYDAGKLFPNTEYISNYQHISHLYDDLLDKINEA